jgi:HAD superfamily hydrolase (TIGR01484 family)
MPIKLISTDFDGTLFAEFETPPIPERLQGLIGSLQQQGAKWVINTGRDMSSLMEALARSKTVIEPDYLVLVEREIFVHHDSSYTALDPWNRECSDSHTQLFEKVYDDLPKIVDWINTRFHARIYEDPFSPFCIIASSNNDMDKIHEYLDDYCATVPNLVVVRNDVYARFSHIAYNKGTALQEISKRLGIGPESVFAAGDHLNDLPMLQQKYARYLVTPSNAVGEVKLQVRREQGFLSEQHAGWGVAEGLQHFLESED